MAGKIRIHNKDGIMAVICNKNVKINTRELEILRKNEIQELVTLKSSMAGGKVRLFYDLTGYVPFLDVLGSAVKKKEYIKIAMSLPLLLDKLEMKYMQKSNLILNPKYMFYNLKTGMIKYIYLPLIHFDKKDETIEFLRMLPYYTVFSPSENPDYVSEYIRFFRNTITFSIYDFKEMIEKISLGGKNSGAVEPVKKNEKKSGNLLDLATGDKIVIPHKKYIIGKNEDCDLVVNSPHVSRQHAYIICSDGIYYVVDMGSTNKTFVDNTPVASEIPVELHNGMQIRFADRAYRFFLQ